MHVDQIKKHMQGTLSSSGKLRAHCRRMTYKTFSRDRSLSRVAAYDRREESSGS